MNKFNEKINIGLIKRHESIKIQVNKKSRSMTNVNLNYLLFSNVK